MELFGECDALLPARLAPGDASGEDHRVLRAREQLRCRVDEVLGRQHRVGRAVALRIRQRRERADLRLLQASV